MLEVSCSNKSGKESLKEMKYAVPYIIVVTILTHISSLISPLSSLPFANIIKKLNFDKKYKRLYYFMSYIFSQMCLKFNFTQKTNMFIVIYNSLFLFYNLTHCSTPNIGNIGGEIKTESVANKI